VLAAGYENYIQDESIGNAVNNNKM